MAPLPPIAAPVLANPTQVGPSAPAGSGFGGVFADAVRNVETQGKSASAAVERFLSGDGEELHTAILEGTRAELAFDLMLQTRNKVVSAYQEIMRMQM